MPEPHTTDLPKPKLWDEFEDMVWNLYTRLWNDPHAQRNGRSGQPQHGVDIYGQPQDRNGHFVGIQCKRYDDGSLTQRMIEQEIAKADHFQPPLVEFIIATTESRDTILQEAVRRINAARAGSGTFQAYLVFWEDICNELTKPANYDLLSQFYVTWAQIFAQAADALPLARNLQRESFKLGDDVAAHFAYVQAPVQEAYDTAKKALLDASSGRGGKHGILAVGEANAGKTRLALEALLQTLSEWPVLCWRPAYTLADLPPPLALQGRNLVVFVDDLQDYTASTDALMGSETRALDPRATVLRAMLERLRQVAGRIVVVATCRSEDEGQVRAEVGFLFEELVLVRVPRFSQDIHQEEVRQILDAFQAQGATHREDWDGTLGSLVLGLSRKNSEYLKIREKSAATILWAMKLLRLIGATINPALLIQATCAHVFGEIALREDRRAWRKAIGLLLRKQFIQEARTPLDDEVYLLIRSDAYLDKVITDYPDPHSPSQQNEDLIRLMDALVELQEAPVLVNLGAILARRHLYERALEACVQALSIDPTQAFAWVNKSAVLHELQQHEEALKAVDEALILDPGIAGAWSNKSAVLLFLKRYEEALQAAEHATALAPDNAGAWENRGAILTRLGRDREALEADNRALRLDPYRPQVWVNKAATLNNLHRSVEALEACERALVLDENLAPAWANKGGALVELGRYEDAMKACACALMLDADLPLAWSCKGLVCSRMGHLIEALEAFEQALTLEPDNVDALGNKIALLVELERNQEALQLAEQLLAHHPNHALTWSHKGAALSRLEKCEDGLVACDHALELDPTLETAWVNRSLALIGLGRFEEALDACQRAFLYEPNTRARLNQAAALFKLGRLEEALQVCDEALGLQPDLINFWKIKMQTLISLKRYEQALEAASQAHSLGLGMILSGVWYHHARELHKINRIAEAIQAVDVVLVLDPDFVDGWVSKSGCLLLLHQHEQAVQAAEQAIKLRSEHVGAWHNKSMALTGMKRHKEALAVAERVLQLSPDLGMAWLLKAKLLWHLQCFEEGLVACDKAIALMPEHSPAWGERGIALSCLGRYDDALVAFDKAIALDPKDPAPWGYKAGPLRWLGREAEANTAEAQATELHKLRSL